MNQEKKQEIVDKLNKLGLSEAQFNRSGDLITFEGRKLSVPGDENILFGNDISISRTKRANRIDVSKYLYENQILPTEISSSRSDQFFIGDQGRLRFQVTDVDVNALDRALAKIQVINPKIEPTTDRSGKKPPATKLEKAGALIRIHGILKEMDPSLQDSDPTDVSARLALEALQDELRGTQELAKASEAFQRMRTRL